MRGRSSDGHSVVAEVCRASIIGFGAGGYHLALEGVPWITELRRDALIRAIEEQAVDAMLVTRLTNVRYLTGFTGSNAQAIVDAGGERVLHRRAVHGAVAPRGRRPRAGDLPGRVRRAARGGVHAARHPEARASKRTTSPCDGLAAAAGQGAGRRVRRRGGARSSACGGSRTRRRSRCSTRRSPAPTTRSTTSWNGWRSA